MLAHPDFVFGELFCLRTALPPDRVDGSGTDMGGDATGVDIDGAKPAGDTGSQTQGKGFLKTPGGPAGGLSGEGQEDLQESGESTDDHGLGGGEVVDASDRRSKSSHPHLFVKSSSSQSSLSAHVDASQVHAAATFSSAQQQEQSLY